MSVTEVRRVNIAAIKRDGGSWKITLPKRELLRLGWNLHDVVMFNVVGKQLIVTRVQLPTVDDIRK